jgi:hypothetical protein
MCGDGKQAYRDCQPEDKPKTAEELFRCKKEKEKKRGRDIDYIY